MAVAFWAWPGAAYAQQPTRTASTPPPEVRTLDARRFAAIGTVEDDARRVEQLTGAAPASGRLFRSPSSDLPWRETPPGVRRVVVTPVWPSALFVFNSAIAYSVNEGTLWAGRGPSVLARGGAVVDYRRLRLVIVPELAYSSNRPFDVFPSELAGRSPYASPWHWGVVGRGAPADLPLRFGDRPITVAALGQSSAVVRAGGAEFGATTEAEWWGPGAHNALVLSNAAPGIPRLFLRTARPLRTPVGSVEGRWFAGTLTESLFFDAQTRNNYRSAAGVALSLAPAGARGLTLGLARLVVRPAPSPGAGAGRFADVLGYWTPAPRIAPSGDPADTARADQLLAVSARQVFPAAGVEVYGEWARQSPPRSLRELALTPQESQAYTLGLQWVSSPIGRAGPRAGLQGARAHLGAEVSYLEQSVAYPDRVARDYYSGAATDQGLTQRGRVLGAFTGPGSSSQWLTAELRAPRWQLGTFGGRIRWENDAMYRTIAPTFYRHDVSLLTGLRATARRSLADVRAEVTYQTRYNYMFQNGFANPGGTRTVDVHNVTIGLDVTPR